jgi:hypothetical protein
MGRAMSRESGRRWGRVGPSIARGSVGALALVVGAMALAVSASPFGQPTTWEGLLAPYSAGAPLLDGFHIAEMRRGPDNGIVVSVRRPADGATVEVLVVERGRWRSAHQTPSFTIDYEVPHSPAAERDAVTAFVAETIRARDHGLPAPDAIPLRTDDASLLPWWLEVLRGLRGTLLGANVVLLAVLALTWSPAVASPVMRAIANASGASSAEKSALHAKIAQSGLAGASAAMGAKISWYPGP